MPTRIDEDVLEVLAGMECSGAEARIAKQLDRPMYLKVNKVLESIGGKWSRTKKAHIFDEELLGSESASQILADVVSLGEYVDQKRELQFYETPEAVVRCMIDMADLQVGMSVLEPSAGRGAIAKNLLSLGLGLRVECVEIEQSRADYLEEETGLAVYCDNFLYLPKPGVGLLKEGGKEPRQIDERFDRVLMNPPFSRSKDIAHVTCAYEWLKPGGRLVSVMSIGWTFRSDRKASEFRGWVDSLGHVWVPLAKDAFKKSGVDVRTGLLLLDKPVS